MQTDDTLGRSRRARSVNHVSGIFGADFDFEITIALAVPKPQAVDVNNITAIVHHQTLVFLLGQQDSRVGIR